MKSQPRQTGTKSGKQRTSFQPWNQMNRKQRREMQRKKSDNIRNVVTKLLETSGRPMIGAAESLLGKPIVICNDMPSAGAGTASIAVLAHPGYLLQRRVAGSDIRMYKTRYVDFGQYGFQSFARFDAQPMLYGSAFPPAASLNQHA